MHFRPPKPSQKVVPVRPPKGHFFFAGREFPRVAWWRLPKMRMLYIYTIVLILSNTANGFDGSMMNGLQSLIYWQNYFGKPRGATLGIFNASMSLGSLIGLFPTPYIIDMFGRKMGVGIGCLIMLLAVGIQTGASNLGMFIAARIILGLGDSIVLGAAPLLIAEISHPQDRAVLVTLSGASYHSGSFLASWITFGTLKIQSDWSWRLPSLLQAICTIFILVILPWMPESPRWFINQGKEDKALAVLAKYHGEGNDQDEFVQLEYAEIKAAINMDRELGQTGWVDLVRTHGNRKRILIITALGFFSQWSGNGLISYYLKITLDSVGITDAQTQLGINAGLKTKALFFNFLFAFFIDRIGRRPLYMISTVGTFVCFNIWTIISARFAYTPQYGLGVGFVIMTYFYAVFYDVKSGLMGCYTTEILPYGLRAKGFTWLNFCVTLALFFNQFINGIALDAIQWRYYIAYCIFLAFECVIIYMYVVETRYTPMEEIAKYFDGDSAVDIAEVANADVKEKGLSIHAEAAATTHGKD